MSDTEYTPTLDEVRRGWIGQHCSYCECEYGNDGGIEDPLAFDRWLAAHDKEVLDKFIDLLWTRIDKRPMPEGHCCVDGELSMECDGHRGYDNAMNEVRNAIKSARRAVRGDGESA
jgi:hypothetical protein